MTHGYDDVVVTGIGTVSSFGMDSAALWNAIKEGEFPAERETGEDGTPVVQVPRESLVPVLGTKGLRFVHPAARFLLAAASSAMSQAGLQEQDLDPDRLGIVVGSNYANVETARLYDRTLLLEGPRAVSAMEAPNLLVNAPAALLGIKLQARACNTTISSGACAGLDALGYALTLLRKGSADIIIVGGTEELSGQLLQVYAKAGVTAEGAAGEAGRPFDRSSQGFIPGEGAAVVVLERRSIAEARGAQILAELLSWTAAWAPARALPKRERALGRVIGQALAKAGVEPEDVGLVVSGASGLPAHDLPEAEALQTVFGTHSVPVCAVKGVTGETGGASGLFQLFTAVRSQATCTLPATAGSRITVPPETPAGLSDQPRVYAGSEPKPVVLTAQDLSGTVSAVVIR